MNISRNFERAEFPFWILYRRLTYISWKPLSSSWPPNIFLAIAQPPVRTNDAINRGSRLRAPSITIVKDVYEGYEWCFIHVGIADEVHQYRVYPQQTTKTHKRVHWLSICMGSGISCCFRLVPTVKAIMLSLSSCTSFHQKRFSLFDVQSVLLTASSQLFSIYFL